MSIADLWARYVGEDGAGFSLKYASVPCPTRKEAKHCRRLCKQNACYRYGVTWGCPPGAGTIRECQAAFKAFDKSVIIYNRYEVGHEDKATIDRISSQMQSFVRIFNNGLRREGYKTLALANGGCNYCPACAYPRPCRFPDMRVPSISGYGIVMMRYLEDNGLDFRFEEGYVTLYGIVLYNEPFA